MTSGLGTRSRRGWIRGGGAVGLKKVEVLVNAKGVEGSHPSTPSNPVADRRAVLPRRRAPAKPLSKNDLTGDIPETA